jgi:hypothetical protein
LREKCDTGPAKWEPTAKPSEISCRFAKIPRPIKRDPREEMREWWQCING